jgi:TonB family protein
VAHAHVIWKREPEYTAEARAAGIGGLVMLSLTVSAQGAPSNIKVIRGLGHGLDEKAAEAVQRWRFEPALREGQPFAEQTQVEVAFSLTGSRGGDNAPRTAEEAFRSGARLVQAQQTEAGIAMFADAIALKPDWAAPYYARAHALYGQKKYDEAIPDFDEAIRREPDRPQWYDERGLAYSYSGRHAPAVEDDTRAIQLVPHPSASLLHHRGWAYLETGQFDKAVADLSKAIQNSPDFLKAYEHRAAAYAQLQDWPHAIADYTAAIELGPARSHYEKRAEARRAAGDAPGADEDSKKAAELFGSAK